MLVDELVRELVMARGCNTPAWYGASIWGWVEHLLGKLPRGYGV